MVKIGPKNTISAKALLSAKKLVLDEINQLNCDYFPQLSYEEFIEENIYPDSKMLLILQNRCLFRGLVDILAEKKLFDFVEKKFPNIELFSVSFLRFHHVNQNSFKNNKFDNFLAGPLHYDNYTEHKAYKAETLTTWIPFQDIDDKTGSLVTTDDNFLIKNTGPGDAKGDGKSGFSSEYFHTKEFLKNNPKYIYRLRRNCKNYPIKKGQCVLFDKTVLHGSTYPKSKDRISFDLRWKKTTKYNSYEKVMSQTSLFKKNALEDLYRYDDKIFIKRNVVEINKKFLKMRIYSELKIIFHSIKKKFKF